MSNRNSSVPSVIHIITGLGQGGAEGVLYRLCHAVIREGADVCVVSLRGRGVYADQLEKVGVRVVDLNLGLSLGCFCRMASLVVRMRRDRPDIVQTWLYHADLVGGVLARIAGNASVVWNIRHTNLEVRRNKLSTLLVVRICALLSRWVPAKIISCSSVATAAHQKIGYRRSKFVEIHNGYDFALFSPSSDRRQLVRRQLGLVDSEFVIGMVARFDPQKDHETLLSALARMQRAGREFKCVLVGKGLDSDNGLLMSLIEGFGLKGRVLLLGSRDDVPDLMRAIDLHVLSSFGEGFPNVLAEAMACGTPCISTNVGEAFAVVGDKGWLVSTSDPGEMTAAISNAMDEWAQSPGIWLARKKASRDHVVAHFSVEQMVGNYRSAWAGVLCDSTSSESGKC